MGIYEELEQKVEAETQPEYGLYFMVFMIIFWPVSLVLGLIDFCLIKNYDLRLVNLVLGGLIAWLGVVLYRRREQRRREANL
ncbi:MAG: hypothetical protein P4L84_31505 [Isosphaeraceae bacterium]|nr:hypothetical protein [Isosphaeraceae bacterium]